jgi:hypothetical protein
VLEHLDRELVGEVLLHAQAGDRRVLLDRLVEDVAADVQRRHLARRAVERRADLALLAGRGAGDVNHRDPGEPGVAEPQPPTPEHDGEQHHGEEAAHERSSADHVRALRRGGTDPCNVDSGV